MFYATFCLEGEQLFLFEVKFLNYQDASYLSQVNLFFRDKF